MRSLSYETPLINLGILIGFKYFYTLTEGRQFFIQHNQFRVVSDYRDVLANHAYIYNEVSKIKITIQVFEKLTFIPNYILIGISYFSGLKM